MLELTFSTLGEMASWAAPQILHGLFWGLMGGLGVFFLSLFRRDFQKGIRKWRRKKK